MTAMSEHAICTCGHQYNGHAHPTTVASGVALRCNHECGCASFTATGVDAMGDQEGRWPNFWELETHNPGAAT